MLIFKGSVVILTICFAANAVRADDLAARSNRGKELMAAGQFEEAIPVYRELVKALPGHPGPLMNLGLALHMTGRDADAAKHFQAVLKLDPAFLPARLFLGAAYLGLKKPSEAIASLKKVVRAQPENQEARLLLGEANLQLEEHESAARQFEALAKLNPENPKVWSGLGLSYEGLASRNFVQLEKLAMGSPYWLVLVAEARAKADLHTRAFLLYKEAQAKGPALRGIHAAIAEIYRKIGHPDWAAREEEKELRLPPLDCDSVEGSAEGRAPKRRDVTARRIECHFWAGRYHELLGFSKDARTVEEMFWRTRAANEIARQAYSRLAQLPPSAELHEIIAKINYSRKNYPAAVKAWREALAYSPGNIRYQEGLAIALSSMREFESAALLLEDLVQRFPDSTELNYWLGYTLLGQLKAKEAIPLLEKAAKGDPTALQLHRDLGRAYMQVEQAGVAIPHLKTALPLDDDGSLHYQLARAYRITGQPELAQEMLEKFREIQRQMAAEDPASNPRLQITPP